MTTKTMLRVFSVQEASVRFEEIFDAALRQPVEIAAEEGRAAYLVSKQDFDAMVATVEELTDQLWLVRAELARKGGFVGTPAANCASAPSATRPAMRSGTPAAARMRSSAALSE